MSMSALGAAICMDSKNGCDWLMCGLQPCEGPRELKNKKKGPGRDLVKNYYDTYPAFVGHLESFIYNVIR